MKTAQRKAQEVASRERQLVALALRLIEEEGFHNLTLGRLAERSAYSKGTLYNHFSSREDLLIELSTESARRQLLYFQAVVNLPWTSVWLLYGLALAYMRHAETSPVLFESSITARTNAVCAVASGSRLNRRDVVESQMAQLIRSVVDQTVADGQYKNDRVEVGHATDAIRAYILGYGSMYLLSSRFLWAGRPTEEALLSVLASMFQGLGWPSLPMPDLVKIKSTVNQLIDGVLADAAQSRGDQGPAPH